MKLNVREKIVLHYAEKFDLNSLRTRLFYPDMNNPALGSAHFVLLVCFWTVFFYMLLWALNQLFPYIDPPAFHYAFVGALLLSITCFFQYQFYTLIQKLQHRIQELEK